MYIIYSTNISFHAFLYALSNRHYFLYIPNMHYGWVSIHISVINSIIFQHSRGTILTNGLTVWIHRYLILPKFRWRGRSNPTRIQAAFTIIISFSTLSCMFSLLYIIGYCQKLYKNTEVRIFQAQTFLVWNMRDAVHFYDFCWSLRCKLGPLSMRSYIRDVRL